VTWGEDPDSQDLSFPICQSTPQRFTGGLNEMVSVRCVAWCLVHTWCPGAVAVHSSTHLLFHALISLLTYSFTSPSLIHSLPHSLTHSLIHSLVHSLTHSFVHSLTHSFLQSLLCARHHTRHQGEKNNVFSCQETLRVWWGDRGQPCRRDMAVTAENLGGPAKSAPKGAREASGMS
jgi:hypothetical protein